jgi:endonuclease YncB( thermonuclease family)
VPARLASAALIGLAVGLTVWQVEAGDGYFMGMCGWLNRGTCVINGDTIQHDGMRIQRADIEAPETQDAKCPREAELGRKAAQRLGELLALGPFDIIRTGRDDADRFGRKLRLVVRDGQSIGKTLLSEGLVHRADGRRHNWC